MTSSPPGHRAVVVTAIAIDLVACSLSQRLPWLEHWARGGHPQLAIPDFGGAAEIPCWLIVVCVSVPRIAYLERTGHCSRRSFCWPTWVGITWPGLRPVDQSAR